MRYCIGLFAFLFCFCASEAAAQERSDAYFNQTLTQSRSYKKLPRFLRPQVPVVLKARRDAARFLQQNPAAAQQLLAGARELEEDEDLSFIAQGADVLFIGEYHGQRQMLKEVNRLLTQLGVRGFTVLATEFVAARHQNVLDDFFKGKINERQLAARLPVAPEYTVMLGVARDQGMRSLALESFTAFGPALRWGVLPEGIEKRNTYWTARLLSNTAAQERVAVHCGLYHALYNAQVPPVSLRLKRAGRKVKVLSFLNPDPIYWEGMDAADPAAQEPFTSLLSTRFNMQKKVLVSVPEKYAQDVGSDYLLYIPPLRLLLRKELKQLQKQARRQGRRHGTTPQRCLLDPQSGLCLP